MEKIIIKAGRGTEPLLIDVIRNLFPECEISILMDPDEGRIEEGTLNDAR